MILCVPVTTTGEVDPRWGRAGRVAVAEVVGGKVRRWDEYDVAWDRLHDEGTEGGHHARVARFVQEHRASVVVAHHMGDPCSRCWAGWILASDSGSAAMRVWLSWPRRPGSPEAGD